MLSFNKFETIRNVFIYYDCDFDAVLTGENKTFDAARANKKSPEVSSCPSHCETIYSNDGYDDGDDDTPQPTGGAANDSRNIVNDGSANMAANNDNGDDDDNNDGDDGDDGGDNESDNGDVDFDGCQKCFCNPCVTQNRQSWLGNAVAPHNKNAELRKSATNYFGKCLIEGRHRSIHCI